MANDAFFQSIALAITGGLVLLATGSLVQSYSLGAFNTTAYNGPVLLVVAAGVLNRIISGRGAWW